MPEVTMKQTIPGRSDGFVGSASATVTDAEKTTFVIPHALGSRIFLTVETDQDATLDVAEALVEGGPELPLEDSAGATSWPVTAADPVVFTGTRNGERLLIGLTVAPADPDATVTVHAKITGEPR